eukprot:216077-Rhodomonas_salina.2
MLEIKNISCIPQRRFLPVARTTRSCNDESALVRRAQHVSLHENAREIQQQPENQKTWKFSKTRKPGNVVEFSENRPGRCRARRCLTWSRCSPRRQGPHSLPDHRHIHHHIAIIIIIIIITITIIVITIIIIIIAIAIITSPSPSPSSPSSPVSHRHHRHYDHDQHKQSWFTTRKQTRAEAIGTRKHGQEHQPDRPWRDHATGCKHTATHCLCTTSFQPCSCDLSHLKGSRCVCLGFPSRHPAFSSLLSSFWARQTSVEVDFVVGQPRLASRQHVHAVLRVPEDLVLIRVQQRPRARDLRSGKGFRDWEVGFIGGASLTSSSDSAPVTCESFRLGFGLKGPGSGAAVLDQVRKLTLKASLVTWITRELSTRTRAPSVTTMPCPTPCTCTEKMSVPWNERRANRQVHEMNNVIIAMRALSCTISP